MNLSSQFIRYASLFSGLGGFEIALNRLSATCVFASEIDKFASKAYELYFGVKPHGDIREVREDDVPDHELLVGGFPCQSFSIAGSRLGFEDARGTLFFEIARIAQRKKPKLLLLENVKGLLSHNKGDTLLTMLRILSHIGYTLDFAVINSKHWRPQHRERVFIVGVYGLKPQRYTVGEENTIVDRLKAKINKKKDIRTFNFPWPQKAEVPFRLMDILEPEVDEKYYLADELARDLLQAITNQYQATCQSDAENPVPTEKEKSNKGYQAVFKFDDEDEPKLHVVGLANIRGIEVVRRVYDPTGLAPTLTTMDGGHREPKIVVPKNKDLIFVGGIGDKPDWLDDGKKLSRNYKQGSRVYSALGIAATLSAQGVGGYGGHTGLYLTPDLAVRKLTPLECFRLQGLPDDYYHLLRANGFSDRQLYKLAGNAVTVDVVYELAQTLFTYLDS